MKLRFTILILTLPLALLAACGTAENPVAGNEPALEAADNLPENPVGLKVTIAQDIHAAPTFGPQAAAAALTISDATLNLEYVKFKMPEGQNCASDAENQADDELDEDNEETEEPGELDEDDDAETDAPELAPESKNDEEKDENHREADCDGDDILFAGPFAINLTDGTSSPSLEDLAIPVGTYTRIKLKISDSEEAGPLQDLTLRASGYYADGATEFAVSMALKFDEEIVIEPSVPVVVDAAGGEDFLVTFPVMDWLKGVDLAGCYASEASSESLLQIGEEDGDVACDNLKDTLKSNFKNSGSVQEDDDDHGEDHEEDVEEEEDEQDIP